MSRYETEILIVGGGAAGMSAAIAASTHARVTIADDNPNLGGQIWRAELGKVRPPDARRLIDSIDAERITFIPNAEVYGYEDRRLLLAHTPGGRVELHFEKLIIATGARERYLPFPGWTLPGVLGAGGLQAMVKGGMSVENKRIVISGTGPLLLAVADFLKARGATIVAILEQSSAASVRRFAAGLWRYPTKIAQAASLRMRLSRVPYPTDSWVTAALGEGKVEQVTINRRGKRWTVDCDYLACGFHLVPNTELASLLGCRITQGFVEVDDRQETSTENLFCAGEPTGIDGVEASLIEGRIAGLSATGQIDAARRLFPARSRIRRFADSLNKAFALCDELRTLASNNTIVCRCEDVDYGRLTDFSNFRDAKLQTRCGMGPCQGRICGAATEFLFGWEPASVRPPIFPVRIEDL